MTYSVWRPELGLYDYYETSPSLKDTTPPKPSLSRSPFGLAPEEAAWKLPLGAKKVGSGKRAKGMIARNGGLAGLGDLLPDFGSLNILVLAVGGFFLWRAFKK